MTAGMSFHVEDEQIRAVTGAQRPRFANVRNVG
jgi:hypothetical protein